MSFPKTPLRQLWKLHPKLCCYSKKKETKLKHPIAGIHVWLCLTYNFVFQINIDSSTRDAIIKSIQEPTQTCFEEAQKIVYMHMEMDSYPRFLKSEMYQNLLKTVQSQNSWLLPKNLNWRRHIASVKFRKNKCTKWEWKQKWNRNQAINWLLVPKGNASQTYSL